MLLDEPLGALDPVTLSELQREFRQLQRRLQKTIVFVTHDVREALFIGDQIGLLEKGRLVRICTPAEFMSGGDADLAPYRRSVELPAALA
jgi:osmoprotectant transport system ATP-binding protein